MSNFPERGRDIGDSSMSSVGRRQANLKIKAQKDAAAIGSPEHALDERCRVADWDRPLQLKADWGRTFCDRHPAFGSVSAPVSMDNQSWTHGRRLLRS